MALPPTNGETIIQDSHLNSAQTVNYINHFGNADGLTPYQILEKNAVLDALFDSDARYDPPKCHPETRTAVLDHIRAWANNPDSQPILWIRGGAGAGKSAIAQTLSEEWDDDGILAATFYFSRTADGRNEKKHLIATIAYQISLSIPASRPAIEQAIRRTPKIFEKNLRAQIKQLIINPLVSVYELGHATARVVVIDGLDECCVDSPIQNHEQQQKEILDSIYSALAYSGFSLRFLIASRPEREIRECFDYGSLQPVSTRVTLDDSQNPSADIQLYLQFKLEEIRKRHPYLGSSWPSQEVISQLVLKSSGHFIYASVVVRYLSSPRVDPDLGLKTVLGLSCDSRRHSPFNELDALYTHILSCVGPPSLPAVMDIFGLMCYGNMRETTPWELFLEPIERMSPTFVAKYFWMSLGQVYLHLTDLHSILNIPPTEESANAPISFLHASFSEFLTISARSGELYIDETIVSQHLVSLSVRHLFIQILSPDSGQNDGYNRNGFAYQTSTAVAEYVKPDISTLEALKFLLNNDETEFVHYVQRTNLAEFGTKRISMDIIKELYVTPRRNRPAILVILKDNHLNDFAPLDPRNFWEHYHESLDWFYDNNGIDKETNRTTVEYLSKEDSNDSPVTQALLIQDQTEDTSTNQERVHQTRNSLDDIVLEGEDCSAAEQLENISLLLTSINAQPYEGESDDFSTQGPQTSTPPSSLLHPEQRSEGVQSARRDVPSMFLRQFVRLGLRSGSPVSLDAFRRGKSLQREGDSDVCETPDQHFEP